MIVGLVQLAAKGVRGINLLGQNVNAYRGPMHDGEIADLATLIHYVAEVDGIDRIRFTTSHPVEFTDSLIEAYANVPKLANYLHLPVQSGSDRTLMRMKRGHTAIEYKQKIRKLRAVRPDISLSSDFIVGFPGETAKDFEDTMNLIAEVGFDQSFSFIYSARPGTPAASLADEVPMEEKKQRGEKPTAQSDPDKACRVREPKKHDANHNAKRCARIDAQQAWVRQRISGHPLHQCARHSQRRTGQHGRDQTRQTNFLDNDMAGIQRIESDKAGPNVGKPHAAQTKAQGKYR